MTGAEHGIDFVVFHAGGWRFAIEARHVAGIMACPAARPEEAVVLAPVGGAAVRLLDLVDGRMLLIEEPVGTRRVAAADIRPLPEPIAARMERPEIKALLWDEDGLVVVADPSRMCEPTQPQS